MTRAPSKRVEVSKAGMQFEGEARYGRRASQYGTQDLALRNVDGVLVVAEFQREHLVWAGVELVGDADSAADDGQCFVNGLVTL